MSSEAIVCIIERGKANEVVKQAVEAGAGGATIFFARGAGESTFSFFHTLSVDTCKEVIIVLVRADIRDKVVEAMSNAAHIDEKGRGLIFTAPISEIRGIEL